MWRWATSEWRASCDGPASTVVHRRRRVITTRRNPEQAAAPSPVRRQFTADGPDRLWGANITYISTAQGFLYLAVMIDVWSRRVVGWPLRDDLTRSRCIGLGRACPVVALSSQGLEPA